MVMRISSLLPSAPTGMNKEKRLEMKRLMFLTGALSLALLACSGDDVSGTSDNPESSAAENESSSSLLVEESSSSLEASSTSMQESSSSAFHALCKVSGDWGSRGGCAETPPSGHGDLWSTGNLKVKTASLIDPASLGDRAGEFFFETDSAEGGGSEIIWTERIFVIPEFKGLLEANIHLVTGNLPYNPFCNIGFNVAGFDSSGNAISADVSDWNGICVLYEGSISPTIQLDLGDSLNQKMGHSLPSVKMVSQKEPQCYEWSQFKQPNLEEGYEAISGEEAAKKVVRIVFHFQEKPNEELNGYDLVEFIAIGTNRDE